MPQITTRHFIGLLLLYVAVALSSCHAGLKLRLSSVNPACIKASHQRIRNATYNTKIDLYNKHFSGLLLFKAINDTNNRVVFVTETGFKLLNIFKNDLGQLIQNDSVPPVSIIQKDSAITFTFARGKNQFEDYLVDVKCSQLTGIKRGGKLAKHVSTKIAGIKKGNFDEIDIYHRPLKLHISLKQIER